MFLVRWLHVNPDSGGKMNADWCESGFTALQYVYMKELTASVLAGSSGRYLRPKVISPLCIYFIPDGIGHCCTQFLKSRSRCESRSVIGMRIPMTNLQQESISRKIRPANCFASFLNQQCRDFFLSDFRQGYRREGKKNNLASVNAETWCFQSIPNSRHSSSPA